MRLALVAALTLAAAAGAAPREVYQVGGKLAVFAITAREQEDGSIRRGATRFMMILDTEATRDMGYSGGSEFKPLFDEVVISSRKNILPGYRDRDGDWLPLQGVEPGSLGALVAATLPEEDRLGFFDFTGVLELRSERQHPWGRPATNGIVGALCLETAGHEKLEWQAPRGACEFLLRP